jgi:hypothetical protein
VHIPDLREGASLWVHLANSYEYLVIDMATGSVGRITHPVNCDPWPIPFTSNLVCEDDGGHVYLQDLVSNDTERLPFEAHDAVSSSRDGTFLLSVELSRREGDLHATYRVYDLIDGEEVTWAPQVPIWSWFGPPVLSVAGRRLAFIGSTPQSGSAVFELPMGSSQPLEIGPRTPMPGGGLAWSPVDMRLAYGAVDYVPEIALPPSMILVLDTESNTVTRTFHAPGDGVYNENGFEWSEDGSMIVATSRSMVCVIVVEAASQNCEKVVGDRRSFRMPVWSPQGSYLATAVGEAWWSDTADIALIDVSTLSIIPVLQIAQGTDIMFWQ